MLTVYLEMDEEQVQYGKVQLLLLLQGFSLNPGGSAPPAVFEKYCTDTRDMFSISKFIADMHVEI